MIKFVQKVASFQEALKLPPLFPTLNPTPPPTPTKIIFFKYIFAFAEVQKMNHNFNLLGFYRFGLSVTDRKQTTFLHVTTLLPPG